MGLNGGAAIVGVAEMKPERKPSGVQLFSIERWAELARTALFDAGLKAKDIDGISVAGIREASMFAPSTVAEYIGAEVNYAEFVDLGGATGAGMIWRAAAAIEAGMAEVVVCALPSTPIPQPPNPAPMTGRFFGASSANFGSPQAEFDIPYGNLAQNCGYAMVANRYAAEFGYDEAVLAKIAVDQRTNACANPNAVFFGQPITVEDVLNSPVIADPLHLLEIVMPVAGGSAVVVTSKEVAARCKNRPVWITGAGERLASKTPTYMPDLVRTPIKHASDRAFDSAGITRADIDMVSIYDCYTITVLLSFEDAGFCGKGEGLDFVREHDLTYKGDFPSNTHGGQLSFGQAGLAGGMSHVTESANQIMGKAGPQQMEKCDNVFVSGNGGILSEQVALILQGD